ncbi:hypothetical protein [Candidatus Dactylopiibacterium carminicum]|uniref:hypothetical protein n=1 Tax=Candidatus Dactylopiibacterium carminicum TaxID=857335 RepID=UPI001140AC59|nr:hypothetical protein [Candidatus Dactylopiibacterium carminicum]
MATGEDWTLFEVESTVADYMHMLTLELSGQKYNKTEHRRALLRQLDGRSEAAVELKHQNISAVLCDLDCHWISGYKPRGNYQRMLAESVEHWISSNPHFDVVSRAAAEQPAVIPSSVNFQRLVVDPPRMGIKIAEPGATYRIGTRSAVKRD